MRDGPGEGGQVLAEGGWQGRYYGSEQGVESKIDAFQFKTRRRASTFLFCVACCGLRPLGEACCDMDVDLIAEHKRG